MMATAMEPSASAASAESTNPGSKGSKVTTKGAWSQIVRGTHQASNESHSEAASTFDAKKSSTDPAPASAPPPVEQQQSALPQEALGSVEVVSPKPVKQAWKKPSSSPKTSPVGPVMGAVSWPALGDTTSEQKLQSVPEVQADQPIPLSPTSAAADKQKAIGKKPAALSDAAVFERPVKFNGDSPKPASGGSRPFYQQGGAGGNYQGNRRNTREQRPSQGWSSPRTGSYYPRDGGYTGMHNRLGPRHYSPQAATTYVNPGFINPAGPPTGMYYVQSPGAAAPMQTGFYGTPGMLVPVPDHASLRQMLVKQIEYYFSIENLCRDIFLRMNMDQQGFIPVTTIAAFNRVRSLTMDTNMILDALRSSALVEVQGDKLRRRHDWMNWLLPAETHAGISHESSEFPMADSSVEYSPVDGTFSGDVGNGDMEQNDLKPKTGGLTTAFGSVPRRTSVNVEPTFQMDEELDPDVYSHDDDDEDDSDVNDYDVQRLIIVTQRGSRGDFKSSDRGQWRKGIPDDLANVINDGLYYYEQELRADGFPAATTSSFHESNGAEANGLPRPRAKTGADKHQRLFQSSPCSRHFAAESPPDPVGFLFGMTPPDVQSVSKTSGSSLASSFSVGSPPVGSIPKPFPRFQHPSHALLEANGFKQQKYVKFQKRCLADRKRVGIGCSEEMNTLFRFWCYFLRTKFNRVMYKHFRSLAEEDFRAGFSYGMECLFRFYSYGLEERFKEDLYQDFEHLTLVTFKKGNLYGLEKYWAFHFYRKGQQLKKNPELERLLNDEFRSLEDFQRLKAHYDALMNGNRSVDSSDLRPPPISAPATTATASASITVS